MSHEQSYEDQYADYRSTEFETQKDRQRSPNRRRPAAAKKRGKGPQSFNGIHRRRKRKVAW